LDNAWVPHKKTQPSSYPVRINWEFAELPFEEGAYIAVFDATGSAWIHMDGDFCFSKRLALGKIHVDIIVLGWDDEAQAGELAGF